MLDHDLATLYDVETKALNQAVKRNIERFPSNFRFQLSGEETNELVTNCDRFEKMKHSSSLPFAFTEQGVAMLSAVLRSQKEGVFYDGQIFDAYAFASDLIRSARKRIILIDNYIDDSVLMMLAKREEGVTAEIVTRRVTESLTLDLKRHNRQYPPLTIRECDRYHDRFLIIDDTVYHLGASLKGLGKKLFAFNRMEMRVEEILYVIR